MAKGSFSCSRCNRKFSMAAHLARHMKAMHGGGKTRTRKMGKKKRGRGRPRGTRGPGRPRAARLPSGADFGAGSVLGEMRAYHDRLVAQRSAIEDQIAAIDGAMQTLGGGAAPRGRGRRAGGRGRRAGRAGSLKDFVVRVLRQHGRPLSPSEIAASVKKAGYKTRAQNLTKAVSNSLPQMPNVRKAGFGLYQLAAGV